MMPTVPEVIVMRLSDAFMRLPLVRDAMAVAWTAGRDAERYGYAEDGNPYSRR